MTSLNTNQALTEIETRLRDELSQHPAADLACRARTASLTDLIELMVELHQDNEPLYHRLNRLDAAICQLELGLYGLCADCEAHIEPERLITDPTEQRCAACDAHYRQEHRRELRLHH